jgi:hypothetical protein
MLLHVPASLDGLLSLLAPCFTQPTFQTFRALLVGQVSQTGPRTVCGMLVGARLSDAWEHSRAHRFFSRARWSPDELGLRIAVLIAGRLTDPGAPLLVAIDDTLLQRWGRRVWGCFFHHDATANSDRSAVAWGNNWVVVGIVVRLAIVDRPVCLPVLFGLWRPRRKQISTGKPDPERPSKPVVARELLDLLAARLPDRQIDVVGDAAYACNAWRGQPERLTVTSRLRQDAAIYGRRPPRTDKRGRPRKWGERLPRLAHQRAKEAASPRSAPGCEQRAHVGRITAKVIERGAAKLVAGLLVEEVLKLKRPVALHGVIRVECGLWIPLLECLDDPRRIDNPIAVDIEHGQRPVQREEHRSGRVREQRAP